MRDRVAALENVVQVSVWLSVRELLFYSNSVTTYFMEQTSAIHSVDTGLIYAVLKLSFSKQYKIWGFNPLSMP